MVRGGKGWKVNRHGPDLRTRLWQVQEGRCFYCHELMHKGNSKAGRYWLATSGAPNRPTLEHIIPRSEGGDTSSDNLVLACASCNSHRRSFALLPSEYERARRIIELAKSIH